jgi:hypothetical protein
LEINKFSFSNATNMSEPNPLFQPNPILQSNTLLPGSTPPTLQTKDHNPNDNESQRIHSSKTLLIKKVSPSYLDGVVRPKQQLLDNNQIRENMLKYLLSDYANLNLNFKKHKTGLMSTKYLIMDQILCFTQHPIHDSLLKKVPISF